MMKRTDRRRAQASSLALALFACAIVLPGCGKEEQPADDALAFDWDQPVEASPKTPKQQATPSAQLEDQPEPESEPETIRLHRSDFNDPNRLIEIADQCLKQIPRHVASMTDENTALAIAYRFTGQPERYREQLSYALERMGTRHGTVGDQLRMLGRAGCYDAIEGYRESVGDPELAKIAARALLDTLGTTDVGAYPSLLEWCWADAIESGKKYPCERVAESQIRLGQIDEAINRLEDSPAKDSLRDEWIVQKIAVVGQNPDRAVPITETIHNANGWRDKARIYLVQAYTELREPGKAQQQIDAIEHEPYRGVARVVRHRVERMNGRPLTEPGGLLAVELIPMTVSPEGASRNHLYSERSSLKNMILEELLIYRRADSADPLMAERGIWGKEKVHSTVITHAMSLYFRNGYPEIAAPLVERIKDGTPCNHYLRVFSAFISDPILTEQDLVNVRPYLDKVWFEINARWAIPPQYLRKMSYAINEAGLGGHETWISFVEQLEDERDIAEVSIGTLESRLNLPGPIIADIAWTGHPIQRR